MSSVTSTGPTCTVMFPVTVSGHTEASTKTLPSCESGVHGATHGVVSLTSKYGRFGLSRLVAINSASEVPDEYSLIALASV